MSLLVGMIGYDGYSYSINGDIEYGTYTLITLIKSIWDQLIKYDKLKVSRTTESNGKIVSYYETTESFNLKCKITSKTNSIFGDHYIY
jgi:hypothetical protein